MRYKYLKRFMLNAMLCAFAISFSVIGVNASDTSLAQ